MSHSILVVDDDPDACAAATKLLWALGYQADVAYDAPTALKLVDERLYSLAVIDYRLPEMNGVDLFRAITQRRPGIIGILLTGFTSDDIVNPAMESGILRVLAKPVDFAELTPIIDEFVGPPF